MSKNVVINGVTYNAVTELKVPTAEDTSVFALFPDTSGDTAGAGDILAGKTAHAADAGVTGTMANNGAVAGTIAAAAGKYTVPAGYHSGSGTVQIAAAEQTKIIPANIVSGATILGVAGAAGNVSTSDATAAAGDLFTGKTAYVAGNKITGTMANNGAVTAAITAKAQSVTIAAGYHNGTGKVTIDTTEQGKIISGNIKAGVTILGVAGSSSVVDTAGGTAAAADLRAGKIAYVGGAAVTGTVAERFGSDLTLTEFASDHIIAEDGTGKISVPGGIYADTGYDLSCPEGSVSPSVTNSYLSSTSADANSIEVDISAAAAVTASGYITSAFLSANLSTMPGGAPWVNNTIKRYINTEAASLTPSTSAQTMTPSAGKLFRSATVAAVSLTGNAAAGNVLSGKTFYNTSLTPVTGTLTVPALSLTDGVLTIS